MRWIVLAAILAIAPAALGGELVAHWTFDEPGVCRDLTGHGHDAGAAPALGRGVHGSALRLRGTHAIQTKTGLFAEPVESIGISAWVKPVHLRSFREIMRQECPRRILFSFQEDGAILSLGLDIGGYVECDAAIDPARVLDGAWHHCAATFDGRVMRVYLDGKRIGQLERPGKIAVDGRTPVFIGSLSGTGEHWEGGIDDLRVYRGALSEEEISSIYQKGSEALRESAKAMQERIAGLCPPADSFAKMLAGAAGRIAARRKALDEDELDAILSAVRAAYPKDYDRFVEYTSASPAAFLAGDTKAIADTAARLVELMLEYKPITKTQWKQQSAEDAQRWREAEAIAAELGRVQSAGDRLSAQWIELILRAGPYVQIRPWKHEAVAPYVRPQTPPVVQRTAAQARELIHRDWLHQAGGNPTPQRIREEIAWTRQLAARIAGVDFSQQLAQLDALERRAAALSGSDIPLYLHVREIKRAIALANPLIDFDSILFIDSPLPQGSEWQHETRHRLGYMAVPGGRLMTLRGLSPNGRLTQLMPQAPLHGSFWRPDLSFDGKTIVFCFKPHNEKSFHLYEINVDGTGLRQLTSGPYDDLDPIYLPDGRHILFSTTRGHTYVRCMPPTNAFILARCDRSGRDVYLLSQNNEPDYLPSVMNDGRVLYTRWEYTDKPLWRAQKLWTMNPDGTQVSTLWGNQSVWPDLVKDARSIPGSRRILMTGSAHHNWFSGSIGLIDPDRGLNFPQGLTKVTADVPWPETGNGPVDPVESPEYHRSGDYPAHYSPYPLGERDFLVSSLREGRFRLYLMDVEGNRELIYEGDHHILHAMPLRARPTPPVIPDRVDWPKRGEAPADGVLFSSNVYEGAPAELAGKAKALRILHIEPKTYTYWYKRPYISTGPVVSIVQSEGVKRILGTVPIEADGSVAFRAPAGMPLHFQLLDERGRALQTMRSFVGLMPGEQRGCTGCHEAHSRAPVNAPADSAAWREPRAITPPPWDDDTVSYPRYVKPVIDRYCGKCHQGDGEGRKTVDLTDRPGFLGFSEPYFLLTGQPTWGQPYRAPANPPPGWGIAGMLMVEGFGQTDPAGYRTPAPMTALSYRSRLIEIASSGKHHEVKVDEANLQRLIAWVDAMCPYSGDEEIRQMADPVFQGVEWLAIRPRIATAPRVRRPGPVEERWGNDE